MKSEKRRSSEKTRGIFFLKQLVIIAVVVASSLIVLYLTTRSDATAKERKTMIQTEAKSFDNSIIAAFDSSAPARTEKATFALG